MSCQFCKGKLEDISDIDHELYICKECGELFYGDELE